MSSFAIQNFGCRVNQAEAFAWAEELQRRGLVLEKRWEQSDFVVVNSCTLTSRADRDVKRFIQKVARENPTTKLILTGCSAERMFEEKQDLPGIWKIIRNTDKPLLTAQIMTAAESRENRAAVPYRSRALVKIQDGCDCRCTYCIIPEVRGKSVSVEENEALARIKRLVEEGYREIVLAGIHLCSYGSDLEPKRSLGDLLSDINSITEIVRIRLSSLDPRLLLPDLADNIVSHPRICPHFHLSLQSGSEKILREMGRPANLRDYMNLLAKLRRNSPQAALGADFIVGFPGETDDDFESTRELLLRSPLTYAHVFPYSPRRGTKAALMAQIDDRIKKTRASELRQLSGMKNMDFRRQYLGQELEAIVIQRKEGITEVLTGNAIKVVARHNAVKERQAVIVRITEATLQGTLGEIV